MIYINRIISVNKPVGPTSHDIVDEVREITGERRVGHAGTLDPLASGVLVIGIGRQATKHLSETVKKEKEYEAEVILGMTSTTDDAEGVKQSVLEKSVSKEKIEQALKKFTGTIQQTPPVYSAIKNKGTPAYRLARKGQTVKLKPREITINEIELLGYSWPKLKLRIVCGPGTYIRALARDLGDALGCGGYLGSLVRTRVGDFKISESYDLSQLRQALK